MSADISTTPKLSACACGNADEASKWRRKAEQVERLVKLGSFEVELDTGALSWSDGTYAMFGIPTGSSVSVEEALGFYDEPVRSQISQQLERTQRSGEPYDLTVPFRTRAGEQRWARMIAQVECVNGSPRLVGVIRDITSERDTEEHLRLQANQDSLTGLSNRRAFQAHLDSAVAIHPGHVAVFLLDVDRFKLVNDAHGHAIGDKLLQAVGTRLSGAIRSTDVLARLGGDEFAIVVTGAITKPYLRQRAANIVAAVRQPLVIDGVTLNPSVSLGICVGGKKATQSELLLKQADIALYKAKLKGRDQFCLFEPSLLKEVDDHSRLLEEVRTGLARDQFEVHYQPIVDLRTRIVRGWEALVRWRHPTRGLLLPGRFMAALSDPKTSVVIDDFVLATSLCQMRQWLDAGVPVTCAGVNVSEAQLKRPDLVERIESLLRHYELTPDRLKIEVLETAFIGSSMRAVAATIDRLARLGVVCALDDFGTGHASLTHLKQFRVERIKIDRSFVSHLGTDGYDQAIVRCMIALGRDLGIRITAEGIETPEQLAILHRLGCDVGQGYLFGRPMHPDAVPEFLRRWHDGVAAKLFGPLEDSPPTRLTLIRK